MTEKPSDKQIEARNSLPDELKPNYDEFVADYKYAATFGMAVRISPTSSWPT